MSRPQLTFLLPVYNNAATVGATIKSILGQTLASFELLVIDDASTDATAGLLKSFNDPRIRIERNPKNLGLPATLNRGLSLATTDLIARIDADDLCVPHRVAVQTAFLEHNPDIAVVGSFCELFQGDAAVANSTISYPTDSVAVAAALVIRCPLAHPSVMFRKSALDAGALRYDESFPRAQDYDLWCRGHVHGLKFANVPEVLLRYRMRPTHSKGPQFEFQHALGDRIRTELLVQSGFDPSPRQVQLHSAISRDRFSDDMLEEAHCWLGFLARANSRLRAFEQDALCKVLCGRWVRILRKARDLGITLNIHDSPLAPYLHPDALEPAAAFSHAQRS